MERDTFLSTVTAAIAWARLSQVPEFDPGGMPPGPIGGDPLDLFKSQLEAVDGAVHVGVDPLDVIAEVVRRHGARRCLTWDLDLLGLPGEALDGLGLERLVSSFDEESRALTQERYVDVDLGITGAEAGFAESGSIVLRSGPGRPRMASLVPPVHVAILERSAIHRSLSHWAATRAAAVSDAANLVFITGPSRTADIEQELTLGVHGPKHVHVVVV